VRTPMQWTSAPAAGFTTAPADAVWRPFPGGEYGPEHVNVEAQRTDPESLLNWFERMIRLRKSMPEIGWGEYRVIDVDDDAVLALEFRWGAQTAVTVHGLARKKTTVSVRVDLGEHLDGDDRVILRDRIGSSKPIPIEDGSARVPIDAHGYRWFCLESAD
jgi:maltose alpha-D-glucosyltransferase / alpha-amylase